MNVEVTRPAGERSWRDLFSREFIQLLLLGTVWSLLFRVLAVHWEANPQYSYGWAVPFLIIFASAGRWRTRPIPTNPLIPGLWCAGIAAVALLPTWLILQPNLDWRSLSWILALEVVAITAGVVAYLGGTAWLHHFAFPILFVLVAVPWPTPLELPLLNWLMRGVATVSVEALNTLGELAVQHGSLIEVRTGMLGVDEACSGVRSLQASLMAALFLGELSRLRITHRLMLVLVAVVVALATNVLRASLLAWIAARNGVESVAKWHDPAGFAILSVCFVAVWAMALALERPLPQLKIETRRVPSALPLPKGLLAGLAVWLCIVVLGTEAWYLDSSAPPRGTWRLGPPTGSAPIEISEAAKTQLRYDAAMTGRWRDSDGAEWQLLFFEWNPGATRSRLLARLHRPEYCLTSAGAKLLEDRGPIEVLTDDIALQFHGYRFIYEGRSLYVYYGSWENRSRRAAQYGRIPASMQEASLQAVLWRERMLGQQVAELAVTGYTDAEDADRAFRDTVREAIVFRRSL